MFFDSVQILRAEIEEAANVSGRTASDIDIIAVTKTRTIEEMQAVSELGIKKFGENKVQEFQSKYSAFDHHVQWHLIGHLQRNKVKYIIDKVDLIHSVDSLRLAKTISKEAKKNNIVPKILIQVNIANEETKYGVPVDKAHSLIQDVSALGNIQVKGLMAMAPFTNQPEENRKYFRLLKELSVDINNQRLDNISMDILSMGMTNDFKIAIEEGSTMIRVGTGIFGQRDYL